MKRTIENQERKNSGFKSYVEVTGLIDELCTLLLPVVKTLGPKGTTMFINQLSTKVTKDGATVLKELSCEDPNLDLLLNFVKENIGNLAKVVGDGTTSTTVLLINILSSAKKLAELNFNNRSIISGIKKGESYVKELLEKFSKKINISDDELMIRIGTISSNGDKHIGEVLTRAIKKVGEHGVVNVDTSYSVDADLKEEYTLGMSLDNGYISPYFCYKNTTITSGISTQKTEIEMQNPYILLCNKRLLAVNESMERILQFVSKSSRPICIIAEDVEGDLLNNLVMVHARGIVDCVAIKAPGFGDGRTKIFHDIAALTGGTVFSDAAGVFLEESGDNMKEFLGTAERIKVTKDKTIIVNGEGSKEIIQERIASLRSELEAMEKKNIYSSYERDNLKERLAKLTGGVCVLKVGGANEAERGEKKDRITDALYAINAAVNSGVSPGGGLTFFLLGKFLQDAMENPSIIQCNTEEIEGVRVLKDALFSVVKTITANCLRTDTAVVFHNLREFYKDKTIEDLHKIINQESNYNINNSENSKSLLDKKDCIYGFDVAKGEYTDLLSAGIINPTGVDRACITTAISIAQQILASGFIIGKKAKED
jgi:chaperonin GroEL